MLKRKRSPEDLTPTPLTIQVPAHVVRDFKEMEKHSKQSVDQLVTTALLMFIATHSDYLGKSK